MKTSSTTAISAAPAAQVHPATTKEADAIFSQLADKWDLEKYLRLFPEITEAGRDYLRRSAIAPCRSNNGTMSNITRWPSLKTGETRTAGSDSAELPATLMADYTPDVLYFEEEPGIIRISEVSLQTKTLPDIVLFLRSGPMLLECRTATGMARKVVKSPRLYKQEDNGDYRSGPIERAAAELGLRYRINTERNYSGKFLQNLLFLQPYYRAELREPVSQKEWETVFGTVADQPGTSLADIPADQFASVARRADVVHALLAERKIFAHLDRVDLRDQRAVQLFLSPVQRDVAALFLGKTRQQIPLKGQITTLLTEGATFSTGGSTFRVIRLRSNKVDSVEVQSGEKRSFSLALLHDLDVTVNPVESRHTTHAIIGELNDRELKDLLRTRRQLTPYLPGGKKFGKAPADRTLRRKLQAFRLKDASVGFGELGLISRVKHRGNRQSVISKESLAILEDVIRDVYLKPGKVSGRWVYREYVNRAEAAGVGEKNIMGYESLLRRLKKIPEHTKTLAREGKRAALGFRPPHDSRALLGSPNGQGPWAVGHIDHTELDVLVLNPDTGAYERPWISAMVDAFDGRRLARHVWFGNANKQVVIDIIKNCVERHGVIPMRIRCDWGAEFRSTSVAKTLSEVGVALSFRKKGEPRDGSPVEGSFSAMDKVWIHNATGNTKALKKPRNTSRSHAPRRYALLELEEFIKLVDDFIATENRAPREHKPSPDEMYAEFIGTYGVHHMHRISPQLLDQMRFVADTDNTRVVSKKGTIRFQCLDYSAPGLANYAGEEVSVFVDESNPLEVKVEAGPHHERIRGKVVDSELKYAPSLARAVEIATRRRNNTQARKKKAEHSRKGFQARAVATEAASSARRAQAAEPVVENATAFPGPVFDDSLVNATDIELD